MAKPKFRRFDTSQDNEDGQMHYVPTNRDSVADQDTAPFPVFYKTTAVFPYQNEDGQLHSVSAKRDSVAEQDTVPLAVFYKTTAVFPYQNEDGQLHSVSAKRDSIEEQDTAPLAVLPGSTPVVPHQVASNLLMVAQRMFSSGLDRLQDPQPEGLF